MEQTILFITGIFVVVGFIFVPIKATFDVRNTDRSNQMNKKGQP